MVQSDTSKSPPVAAVAQESQMELLESAAPAGALGAQSYGKGARRKNRFKGSDGSTSSDTTSNSFVRQLIADTSQPEHTFIAIKPDGVQRSLVGEIIKRFEQKGFYLVAMKFLRASEEHLKQLYIDLKDCPVLSSRGR